MSMGYCCWSPRVRNIPSTQSQCLLTEGKRLLYRAAVEANGASDGQYRHVVRIASYRLPNCDHSSLIVLHVVNERSSADGQGPRVACGVGERPLNPVHDTRRVVRSKRLPRENRALLQDVRCEGEELSVVRLQFNRAAEQPHGLRVTLLPLGAVKGERPQIKVVGLQAVRPFPV